MRRGAIAVVTVAAASLGAGCTPASGDGSIDAGSRGDEFVLAGVRDVTQVARLTGPGAVNDTDSVAVAGTDLDSMLNVGDRTYFFFGDTFGVRDPDSIGGQGENWRSNVVAWTTDAEPADGIAFDGWVVDEWGLAKEIAPGLHEADGFGEVTKIPTYAFEVEGAIYAFFMSVRHWGDPGVWEANYAGLARSTDDGASWEVLEEPRWPGDGPFVQVSAAHVREDGQEYVYLWGIPAGRFGGVSLMRVPANRAAVENLSQYQYFSGAPDGRPEWSDAPSDAALVLDRAVGEFSVVHNEFLDRWLISYMADNQDAVVAEGLSPWGPWGEPFTLTSQAETPGLYAPYLNPRYVADGGRTVYFTLSIWGPYSVFWYAADLVARDATSAAPSGSGGRSSE